MKGVEWALVFKALGAVAILGAWQLLILWIDWLDPRIKDGRVKRFLFQRFPDGRP